MAILLLDRFLYKAAGAWVSNSGPNINDPASVLYVATQQHDGGMVTHNALDKEYAGALVSLTHAVPSYGGKLLHYAAWHYMFRFVPETYGNLARFENDIKVCVKSRPNSSTQIRNVCNWSTQWNVDTGAFQLDHDPPTWVDSGYVPSDAVTTPDDWHSLDFRYSFDDVALTFSIESVKWDDERYMVPSEHRNIPMQSTNWEQCTKFQHQTEGFEKGTVLIEFDEGVMAWSDQPIGAVIPERESYDDESLVDRGTVPVEMEGWTQIMRKHHPRDRRGRRRRWTSRSENG